LSIHGVGQGPSAENIRCISTHSGKDRREGEKQAANDWPEAGRDDACDYRHRPAEHKPDEILVPARLAKGGRLELKNHES
jgi:hypothetical protein